MNEFVPRGYLTLEMALEHFGQLKHADEWEAEKASSKQEFQRRLFAADLSAEVLTDDGILHSLRSRIWGSVEAARIFETGRASISVGDEYFPATVHGPVLIKQSSIDALFDSDSDDPSQSPEAISVGTLTAEAPQRPVDETKGSDKAQVQPQRPAKTEDEPPAATVTNKAEDGPVGPPAEPPAANKHSVPKVRRWYQEDYIPEQVKLGERPNREAELTAARVKFGDGVPRTLMRELRRDYAPANFKKTGPRRSGKK